MLAREVPCKYPTPPAKPEYTFGETLFFAFMCALIAVVATAAITTAGGNFEDGMAAQKKIDDEYRPADKTTCVSDNGYVMCSNGFIAVERNSVGYTNSLPTTRYCPSGYIAADGFCRY